MITPSFGLTATERVLPKLALDFTTASLDGRVTFTRSGNTATVTGSNGYIAPINADLPRFDYDPVTLVCKGLLIEEQRTNLLKFSEQFDNAVWTKINSTVTANDTVSPDGTVNADKLVEDTANSTHGISQLPSLTATTHTFTVCAKAAERDWIRVTCVDGVAFVNLSSGVFGTVSAGTVSFAAKSITAVGNGWYRVEVSFTAASGGNTVLIRLATSNGNFIYTGDGVSGAFIWGAQLEAGAFATSYIPTTTTTVTRNADVATMTGTNFSDWFNATEGTFEIQASPNALGYVLRTLQISNATTNETMWLTRAATNVWEAYSRTGSVTTVSMSNGADTSSNIKQVLAYKTDNFASARNGNTTVLDNTGTVPTGLSQVDFGRLVGSSVNYLNGVIQKVNYWPQRLTNAEVQAFSKG
jgi:hypothetical protein